MAAHPPGEFVATSVLATPWQALSGDETKRPMALVNADREIVRKIMTEPGPRWEPQSPPAAPKMQPTFSGGARGGPGLTLARVRL